MLCLWREALIGKSEAEVKAKASPIPYLVSMLALFVMAVVLAMRVEGSAKDR